MGWPTLKAESNGSSFKNVWNINNTELYLQGLAKRIQVISVHVQRFSEKDSKK